MLILNFTIFRRRLDFDRRNGLSNGSFPQNDDSMPRPSRLSEIDSGKIPIDKEVLQPHPVRRLPHRLYQINLSATPLSERKSGRVQTQSQERRASGASTLPLGLWFGSLQLIRKIVSYLRDNCWILRHCLSILRFADDLHRFNPCHLAGAVPLIWWSLCFPRCQESLRLRCD